MHVWVDMLTPKQVLFFEPFIENLRERGDDVRVTSRHYREAELMVRKRGLKVDFVGAHGGKNLSLKLLASIERMRLLQEMFDGDPPDFAVSFSSPEAARVAYGLGMMNVTVNDSPHATAVARLTLPLSDALLCPWIIPNEAWTRYGVSRGKIFHYKALDPFVWLKRRDLSNTDMPDLDLDYSKGTIVLRLEESFASYLMNVREMGYTEEFALLRRLADEFRTHNIVVLCRYSEQIDTVMENFKGRVICPPDLVDGVSLLLNASLFIGMGGTMTAEAALLGVPAISFFRGSYFVERYLISKELLTKPRDIDGVIRNARHFLRNGKELKESRKRAKMIRSGMHDPVKVITARLDSLMREKLNQRLAR